MKERLKEAAAALRRTAEDVVSKRRATLCGPRSAVFNDAHEAADDAPRMVLLELQSPIKDIWDCARSGAAMAETDRVGDVKDIAIAIERDGAEALLCRRAFVKPEYLPLPKART